MKFALIQMNPTVGAVKNNAAKILRLAQDAAAAGADVAVFPELALCGYPPDDLVLRPSFLDAVEAEVEVEVAVEVEVEGEGEGEVEVVGGVAGEDSE